MWNGRVIHVPKTQKQRHPTSKVSARLNLATALQRNETQLLNIKVNLL